MIHDPTAIQTISHSVYQTILDIYQQYPHWLSDSSRKYPWQSREFQLQFTAKLAENLSQTENQDRLIAQLMSLLNHFFTPPFWVSYQFTELIAKVRRYNHPALEIEARKLSQVNAAIGILLLDAENLTLDLDLEQILHSLSSYPIKIRLAFANWRSLGKKDLELHSRGYELIHVPPGKNNADEKMIAFGASLEAQYPSAREVFVCSSDEDLNSLCRLLHNQGLIVYRVSRRADELIIFNLQTEKTTTHSLVSPPEIPLWDDFIGQVKEVIKKEQLRTKQYWLKLSKVSQLFQTQYKLTLSQVLAHYLPGKKVQDFFREAKTDFAVHQLEDQSQLYLTLFMDEIPQIEPVQASDSSAKIESVNINSRQELETALVKIVQALKNKNKQDYVLIGDLSSQFYKQYKIPITQAIKSLQLGSKLPKFLQSCQQFKIKQEGTTYQIYRNKDNEQ